MFTYKCSQLGLIQVSREMALSLLKMGYSVQVELAHKGGGPALLIRRRYIRSRERFSRDGMIRLDIAHDFEEKHKHKEQLILGLRPYFSYKIPKNIETIYLP